MAERSKALVLGTSHFGGASSNLAPVIIGLLVIAANCVDEIEFQYKLSQLSLSTSHEIFWYSECKVTLV